MFDLPDDVSKLTLRLGRQEIFCNCISTAMLLSVLFVELCKPAKSRLPFLMIVSGMQAFGFALGIVSCVLFNWVTYWEFKELTPQDTCNINKIF